MAFDGLIFRRVATLVNEEVSAATINRVDEIADGVFVFELYKRGSRFSLLVSTDPAASFFTLTKKEKYAVRANNHFLNLMRTHVEGGKILSFTQLKFDRIAELSVLKKDDVGDPTIKKIYLEFLGRMTNLILTKQDGRIIDAFRRMGPNEATKRTLYGGATYRVPPLKTMKDPLTASYDPELTYASQFYGVSPLIDREWTTRDFQEDDIRSFTRDLLNSRSIYVGKVDNKPEFHFLPLKSFNDKYEEKEWSEGIREFYAEKLAEREKTARVGALLRLVRKEIKKARRKEDNITRDYETALKYPENKEKADLLYTYADLNAVGLTEITLENKVITLDARYSVGRNAQKYYDKYRKGKKALAILEEQIEIARQTAAYFELLAVQINDADPLSLQEINEELSEKGYISLKSAPKKKKEKKTFNVLKFRGPQETIIEVGKNNIQNDYLTFKYARKDDYFFHVKDLPGAHVIVRAIELNEEIIRFAANLAAYYSKARYSSTVPVNYTVVKNVKKPSGYRFGQVSLLKYKTIYIDPVNADKYLI